MNEWQVVEGQICIYMIHVAVLYQNTSNAEK